MADVGRRDVAFTMTSMAPHSDELKQRVGVRELRDRLNSYVDQVAGGREVIVTVRGRAVARLSPIEAPDPLSELRRRGLIREPRRSKQPARTHGLDGASGSVADLVAEQRR